MMVLKGRPTLLGSEEISHQKGKLSRTVRELPIQKGELSRTVREFPHTGRETLPDSEGTR
jgi:hypothetical protein